MRRARRPSYSGRAFSRDIGLTPSHLAQLFSRTKNLSETKASEVLGRLSWSEEDQQVFWLSFKSQTARTQGLRSRFEKELEKFKPQAVERVFGSDELSLISDWYHYAIIELLRTEAARSEPEWIAKKLDITREQTESALERLVRLGLAVNDGGIFRTTTNFYTTGDVPSRFIRKSHKQHLRLAGQALQQQDFGKRDFSGVTMAIDESRLPEAKKRIRDFRRQLMRFLEGGSKRRVYRFSTQLFALDRESQ